MERITPSVYHTTSAAHYLKESHYQMFDGLITCCTAQHPYEVTSCPTREGSNVKNNICTVPDSGTVRCCCSVIVFS